MASNNKKRKKTQWMPPKGSKRYFSAASDKEFKSKHPIGYTFLCILGIIALMLPIVVYLIFAIPVCDTNNSPWIMLGWVGAFIVGVGLFNFVAIFIKQYLGLFVSVASFIIGGVMIALSFHLMA